MKKFVKSLKLMAIAVALSSVFTASCPPGETYGYTVLLPDPTCCSRFFSCSNGIPILMHCPDGLHFNDMLDVCAWPQSVNCGNRPLECTNAGGTGGGGGSAPYCHCGGKGAKQCEINAGTEVFGFGASAGCSVECYDGYYACCSLRCTCVKF